MANALRNLRNLTTENEMFLPERIRRTPCLRFSVALNIIAHARDPVLFSTAGRTGNVTPKQYFRLFISF